MTWPDAIEIMVTRTGCERLRTLCAESWPDHAAYRALMIRLALDLPPEPEPSPADRTLQDYMQAHPCGNC